MAENSQNNNTYSYLMPNFKANVGQPPKTVSEQRLINYVGSNKYDKGLTPLGRRWQGKIFKYLQDNFKTHTLSKSWPVPLV